MFIKVVCAFEWTINQPKNLFGGFLAIAQNFCRTFLPGQIDFNLNALRAHNSFSQLNPDVEYPKVRERQTNGGEVVF